jgi:hypothetical protein
MASDFFFEFKKKDIVSLSKGAAFDKGELSLKFSPEKATP